MDVHIRDLRYFLAVAEEMHFGRAAQRLFISQPALSRQIAKLERDLRIVLLTRNRRAVALTPAGVELAERCRVLLACWDETQRAVSDCAAAASATLRVGMQTSLGRGIVAAMQSALVDCNPLARMELVLVDWGDPTVGLGSGSVDIAVGWLPLPDPALFATTPLVTEPCYVALPAAHPLAQREFVTFADIEDLAFVALPDDAGALRKFWLADYARRSPAKIATIARNVDEALEAVAAGIGVVLLSKGNAELYRRDAIVAIEVLDLAHAELAVITRLDENRHVVRHLIEELIAQNSQPESSFAHDVAKSDKTASRPDG